MRCAAHPVEAKQNVYMPKNLEAIRRIDWFNSTLRLPMPQAIPVAKMKSVSTLTPYYGETVLFSWEQLQEKENGYSLLSYLQMSHYDEWQLFADRMRTMHASCPESFPSAGEGWPLALLGDSQNEDLNLHVRIWASLRGQTLFRTAHGIIKSYEKRSESKPSLKPPQGASAAAKLKRLLE